jgi:hypothetical protein
VVRLHSILFAPDSVAQLAEHPAFNRRRAGSSPAGVKSLSPQDSRLPLAGWPSGEGGGLQIHRHHAPTGSSPVPVFLHGATCRAPARIAQRQSACFVNRRFRVQAPVWALQVLRARSSTGRMSRCQREGCEFKSRRALPPKFQSLSWRNWHTQRSQKPRPVRGCRFKSCREHFLRACSSIRKSPCLPSRLLWVQVPSGTLLDPVAQLEEPWTSNPQVAGSIPARARSPPITRRQIARIPPDPVAQTDSERRPPKPKAAGSNPAGITSRSRGGIGIHTVLRGPRLRACRFKSCREHFLFPGTQWRNRQTQRT